MFNFHYCVSHLRFCAFTFGSHFKTEFMVLFSGTRKSSLDVGFTGGTVNCLRKRKCKGYFPKSLCTSSKRRDIGEWT